MGSNSIQFRIILGYLPGNRKPWLMKILDRDGETLQVMEFLAKHEAEQFMDSYSFVLSRLDISSEYGL